MNENLVPFEQFVRETFTTQFKNPHGTSYELSDQEIERLVAIVLDNEKR